MRASVNGQVGKCVGVYARQYCNDVFMCQQHRLVRTRVNMRMYVYVRVPGTRRTRRITTCPCVCMCMYVWYVYVRVYTATTRGQPYQCQTMIV